MKLKISSFQQSLLKQSPTLNSTPRGLGTIRWVWPRTSPRNNPALSRPCVLMSWCNRGTTLGSSHLVPSLCRCLCCWKFWLMPPVASASVPNSKFWEGVGQGVGHGIHRVWTCSGLVGFCFPLERESMTTVNFFMTLIEEVEEDSQKLLSQPGSKYHCVGVSGP